MAGVDLPCELVCTSIPSHVEEGVELVSDIWNGLVRAVSRVVQYHTVPSVTDQQLTVAMIVLSTSIRK